MSSYSKIPQKTQNSINSVSKSSKINIENKYHQHQLYEDADQDEDFKDNLIENHIESELNNTNKRSAIDKSCLEKNEFNQIKTSNSSVSIANSDDSGANLGNLPKKICVGRGLLMSILIFI